MICLRHTIIHLHYLESILLLKGSSVSQQGLAHKVEERPEVLSHFFFKLILARLPYNIIIFKSTDQQVVLNHGASEDYPLTRPQLPYAHRELDGRVLDAMSFLSKKIYIIYKIYII